MRDILLVHMFFNFLLATDPLEINDVRHGHLEFKKENKNKHSVRALTARSVREPFEHTREPYVWKLWITMYVTVHAWNVGVLYNDCHFCAMYEIELK